MKRDYKLKRRHRAHLMRIFMAGFAGMVLIAGCNKLDQFPLASLSPETFFKTENDLKTYTNQFYNYMVPGGEDIYYNITGNADDQAVSNANTTIKGNRLIPSSGGGWSWTNLRRINFYLSHSNQSEDQAARIYYDAVARFFRAVFYFEMVKTFGDVPWYSEPIESSDDELLQKPRDSRKLVIDSVLADLDYAIENLSTTRQVSLVSKWTALALKSRVCLFEGTFRKYHQNDVFGKDLEGNPLGNGEELLEECVKASEELMKNSGYSIYKSTPGNAYRELFSSEETKSSEVIFAHEYSDNPDIHYQANFRTLSASYGRPGVNKQLINSYLMKDGTRFTDLDDYDQMVFVDEMKDRDPRLYQTIRTPTNGEVPDFQATLSGYQWIKFVTGGVNKNNTNDVPIFRFAEVLLNYSEAKAELGELTQEDLDKSIGLLRDRVGMPSLNLMSSNNDPDPYLKSQYTHVSGSNEGIILEIRRERRIELCRENFRWWDLMRWSEGHLMVPRFKGMFFPGPGEYDLSGDGQPDFFLYEGTKPSDVPGNAQVYGIDMDLVLDEGDSGNIISNPDFTNKVFDEEKDYLYPLPTNERIKNRNLKQNPGWFDGIGE